MVESRFEAWSDVWGLFLEGVQDRHERFTCSGAGIRLRTEADVSGDDQGAQVAFSEVVVGWDAAIRGPVIQAAGFFSEDVLKHLDGGMTGLGRDDLDDV